jgi:hypothetical protein
MDFNKVFPENLYHSYVLEGDPNEIAFSLRVFFEDRGDVNKHSGDILLNLYDSFSISDSELIKNWHNNKPTEGKKKICIIGTKFINREAEQTLLKIIEEPNQDTHFFIIIPDSSLLLDTILSRVQLVKNFNKDNEKDDIFAKEFLNLTKASRIEKIAEIIKEFKDNENSGGLRNKAISLVNGIERIVYNDWKNNLDDDNRKFILNELKNCRDYLSTPGAFVKMILEHIALII